MTPSRAAIAATPVPAASVVFLPAGGLVSLLAAAGLGHDPPRSGGPPSFAGRRRRFELPRAKEDPRGRFSRTLHPTHFDASQAREFVARPPRSNEDLPVGVG